VPIGTASGLWYFIVFISFLLEGKTTGALNALSAPEIYLLISFVRVCRDESWVRVYRGAHLRVALDRRVGLTN
jgi:hypothetical protein